MNRTERRQMQRAMGHRGSKAKRKGRPRPDRAPQGLEQAVGEIMVTERPELSAAMADHQARQEARTRGLLVPPSAQEREALRAKGHTVPLSNSGLILPST